jgi:mRNA interferase MazF
MPPPAGRRPAVLLSRDAAYRVRAAITVAPITRTIRNIPVEVALDRSDGMPAHCVVNLDDITTLPKVLIKQRIPFCHRTKNSRRAIGRNCRRRRERRARRPVLAALPMNEPGSAASELDARYWGWVRFVWNARFTAVQIAFPRFRNSDPADEIIAAKM